MSPEEVMKARLECLKIAKKYSRTKKELVRNAKELMIMVIGY
jgi:hypothetical protein